MALHRDTNPDLGISKATQHQHAAQGSELSFLMPASWAISAWWCITHTRDGLLGLIAANQENKQRGTVLDPEDQSTIKEGAVTWQYNLFWPQTTVTKLFCRK